MLHRSRGVVLHHGLLGGPGGGQRWREQSQRAEHRQEAKGCGIVVRHCRNSLLWLSLPFIFGSSVSELLAAADAKR